jgi:RNase P subunit RPR2
MGFEKLPNSESGEVKIGSWYLCAICKTCGQTIPILEILKDAPVVDDGSFSFKGVPCLACGAKHDYPMGSLEKVQAEPPPAIN